MFPGSDDSMRLNHRQRAGPVAAELNHERLVGSAHTTGLRQIVAGP